VLALDIATRTGWAYGARGDKPLHGVLTLPTPALGIGATGAAFNDGVADLLTVHQPARIVVEMPFFHAAGSPITIETLLGLNMMAHVMAYRWDLAIEKVPAVTCRKAMLGQTRFGGRKQGKDAVMAWCRAQGWTPHDDNAGDALVLWGHAVGYRPLVVAF
jgi:Holliday junction resolvasome RuvABC endonuclease subunit